MQITAKTTPRAIRSFSSFSKMPKAAKSRMDPKVINLPNFPSDFKLWIPAKKSKWVKNVIKRKLPNIEAKIPIAKPIKISVLFIPFPSIKLLNSVMSCQIKLNGNY